MSTYLEIKQSDFEKVLTDSGTWDQVKDQYTKENIYLLSDKTGFGIKIYSSIVDGISRDVGKDAIRVIAWDNVSNSPIKSAESRVYRTENWQKNLKERIEKVRTDLLSVKKCLKCGSVLVERTNRTTQEKFWGCLNYKNHNVVGKPKTINTNNSNYNVSTAVPPTQIDKNGAVQICSSVDRPKPPIPLSINTDKTSNSCLSRNPESCLSHNNENIEIKFNRYQEAIFDFIRNRTEHLVIKANAGTGKTTTIEYGTKCVPEGKSVLFIAFNKSIVTELKRRAPPHVDVGTFHSFGLGACFYEYGNIQVVQHKQRNIIQNILLDVNTVKHIQSTYDVTLDEETIADIKATVNRLCSLVKGSMVEPTEANISHLIDWHTIDTLIPIKLLAELTETSLMLSKANTREVNYDDMCWIPVVNNLQLKKYDVIFIDELQDTNKNQIELVMRALKEGGRIIGVGDPAQALYGFRGADTEAMPSIIQRLNATTKPLSVCYRCPKSHVKLAQKFEPSIEYAETAIEGVLENIDVGTFYNTVNQGDMVLCRYNAPLVEPAFELLSKGIKVCIRGHDIGENLVTLIKRFKVRTIQEFHNELEKWRASEVRKCEIQDKSIDLVQDKYMVLKFLSEDCQTFECIVDKIRKIFSDEIAAITFSSIHKAKGLEAYNVFVLNPSNMPSKYAKKEWEKVQEQNIQYVCYTRGKKSLYLVETKSGEW